MAAKNLVSKPIFTTPFVDEEGFLTRAWAIWIRDLYRRTAYKPDNAIDINRDNIDDVLGRSQSAAAKSGTNAKDISTNKDNIASHGNDSFLYATINKLQERIDSLE